MTTERGTRLNNKVAIVTGAGATGSGEFVGHRASHLHPVRPAGGQCPAGGP